MEGGCESQQGPQRAAPCLTPHPAGNTGPRAGMPFPEPYSPFMAHRQSGPELFPQQRAPPKANLPSSELRKYLVLAQILLGAHATLPVPSCRLDSGSWVSKGRRRVSSQPFMMQDRAPCPQPCSVNVCYCHGCQCRYKTCSSLSSALICHDLGQATHSSG